MKKTAISILFCLFLAMGAYAQDWSVSVYSTGTKYPGYIIKTDGTKQEGYIKAKARAGLEGVGNSNQNVVEFYTDPKDKKTKTEYKPADLKEYKIADKVYRSMHYSGGLSSKPLSFVLLASDGHIARYTWYDQEGYIHGLEPTYKSKVIYQKGDDKPVELADLAIGFAKKISAMVSDDAELAAKVTNKEKGYGMLDLEKIIAEYNAWYEKNNAK
ncbi:MAG: hypothetical protein P4L28_09250 [Paludibacteraceae bacterium]|nr:hypothetical protein [Paludibacteraceae bacterium]